VGGGVNEYDYCRYRSLRHARRAEDLVRCLGVVLHAVELKARRSASLSYSSADRAARRSDAISAAGFAVSAVRNNPMLPMLLLEDPSAAEFIAGFQEIAGWERF
jgi:hypothetical protein